MGLSIEDVQCYRFDNVQFRVCPFIWSVFTLKHFSTEAAAPCDYRYRRQFSYISQQNALSAKMHLMTRIIFNSKTILTSQFKKKILLIMHVLNVAFSYFVSEYGVRVRLFYRCVDYYYPFTTAKTKLLLEKIHGNRQRRLPVRVKGVTFFFFFTNSESYCKYYRDIAIDQSTDRNIIETYI